MDKMKPNIKICFVAVLLILALVSCEQEVKVFRVSFVLGETPYSYQDVISGQKADKPVQPGNEGYLLVWYENPEFTEEYDFNSPVTADLVLYGNWSKQKAKVPESKHLVYDGTEQKGIDESAMYSATGTVFATDAGYYKAVLTLENGYIWEDGTTEAKTVAWTISRRPVSVTGETSVVSYDGAKHTLAGYSVEGLLKGHTLSGIEYKAEGTDFGRYDGSFSGEVLIKNGKQDVSNNYDAICKAGFIRIIKAEKENVWTADPSIGGWTYGEEGNEPTGASLFGNISYIYSASAGFEETITKPRDAGTWYMRARVEATEAYGSLESVVSFTIAKAVLDISGITASDKTYDGTTDAGLDLSGITAEGLIPGDSLTYSALGTFECKDVGERYVTISDFSISGEDSGNYSLGTVQDGTTATIGKKNLTITGVIAANKTYDGTTGIAVSGGSLVGVVGEDDAVLDGSTAFGETATADAGENKAVTVTGYAITGEDSGNYILSQPQGVTASIAKAPSFITTAPTGNTADYDSADHPMATAGTCTGGSLVYSLDSETWTTAIPTMRIPSRTTLSYKVAGDGNHTDSDIGFVTCTVNPVVTFNSNGHGTAPSPVKLSYGAVLAKPVDLEAEGLEFKGWFTDRPATQAYDFSSQVTSNITLYAKWTANECGIHFDANGGIPVATVLTRVYNTPYGELPVTERTGYFFSGWYKDETLVIPETTMDSVGDVTLVAGWTPLYVISDGEITGITAKGLELINEAFIVPAEIDGNPITALSATELAGNTVITAVNLGNVATVGPGVFTGCGSVTDLTACPSAAKEVLTQLGTGNGVTDLTVLYREGDTTELWTSNGSGDCCGAALVNVTISEGITGIPASAFRRCGNLTSVSLPSSLASLGERCFQETGLRSVVIPPGVLSIPEYAFGNCPSLKTVALQGNVENIETYAFWFCQALETVSGGRITEIGAYAFQQCRKLEAIDLSRVFVIGSSAFNTCSSFTEIELPNITVLDISSFANCIALETVTMGNKTKTLGAYAFNNCQALDAVTIAGTVTAIGTGVFEDCPSAATITLSDMTGPDLSWTAGWNGDCSVIYGAE